MNPKFTQNMGVTISNDLFLELLENRLDTALELWSSPDYKDLYMEMYKNYCDEGVFEGVVDINEIIDNDIINYTAVITKDDEPEDYQKLLNLYKKGNYDISCDNGELKHNFSFIEAVDEKHGYILGRY